MDYSLNRILIENNFRRIIRNFVRIRMAIICNIIARRKTWKFSIQVPWVESNRTERKRPKNNRNVLLYIYIVINQTIER